MILRLLADYHLEILSLGSPEYTCQNATLLEITCRSSYVDDDEDDEDNCELFVIKISKSIAK